MKITSIDSLGLFGKSPKGGWSNEIRPEDSIHALVVIKTDAGHVGIGSVFTDARLVEAAIAVLRPLLIGESANEPMRVTEKLHQNSFWMGRGGSLTRTPGSRWTERSGPAAMLSASECKSPACRADGARNS